ncbi:MAG: hypothetical protein WC102_01860, partial [Saccharofermentanales bacterium]
IDGARGVIMNFTGGKDMKLKEVDEAASVIRDAVSPDSDIIFGAVIDQSLEDEIMITVIASGFDRDLSSPDVKEQIKNRDARAEISGDDITPETEKKRLVDVPDFLSEIDDISDNSDDVIEEESDSEKRNNTTGSGFMTVGDDAEESYGVRQAEDPKIIKDKDKKQGRGLPWFLQNNG